MELQRRYQLMSGEMVLSNDRSKIDAELRSEDIGRVLASVESHDRDFIKTTCQGVFEPGFATNKVVKTLSSDRRFYAFRLRKDMPSRFVYDREPEPTKALTLLLSRSRDNSYFLLAAYPGQHVPPEIWDIRAHERSNNPRESLAKSIDFWSNHAFLAQHFEYELADQDKINNCLLSIMAGLLDLQSVADQIPTFDSIGGVVLADPEFLRQLVHIYAFAAHLKFGFDLVLDPQDEGYAKTKKGIELFGKMVVDNHHFVTRKDKTVVLRDDSIEDVLELLEESS